VTTAAKAAATAVVVNNHKTTSQQYEKVLIRHCESWPCTSAHSIYFLFI
jgi:hypothetical protein